MRLDLFLKMSRLIKRRSIAKLACDNEKISVNGKISKASFDVKIGDTIKINTKQPPVTVRVLNVSKQIGKKTANEMFETL